MKEKIKKIWGFIKNNWFKLALLIIIIWFGLVLNKAIYRLSNALKTSSYLEIINYDGMGDYCKSHPLNFNCGLFYK